MNAALNRDRTVAVDPDYYWQPMAACPLGVKVQLLGAGGVATYGIYIHSDPFWTGWAPLPKVRRPGAPSGDMKREMEGEIKGDQRFISSGEGHAMLITSSDGFVS